MVQEALVPADILVGRAKKQAHEVQRDFVRAMTSRDMVQAAQHVQECAQALGMAMERALAVNMRGARWWRQ
jgi:Lhr-like helicase